MKTCLRCNDATPVSLIGSALKNFVCDYCRLDDNSFHWGHDTTVRDMEPQLSSEDPLFDPEDENLDDQTFDDWRFALPKAKEAYAAVSWKDGRKDWTRQCQICNSRQCKHGAPVHSEAYRERNK
jgi:hypothetical protein